jgi:hypothetical protein
VASLPEGRLPSLSALVEEVRAPGAARAEVDALLAGLSQPLPPDHPPRERADLLLSLIGDDMIASYTGTNGRTVRAAAIQALIALGYPYALEVPPEALEAMTRDGELTGPGILSTSKGRWGSGLVTLAGVLQLFPALYFGVGMGSAKFLAISVSIIAGTTFIPALAAILGQHVGSRGLKSFGLGWLKFAATLWAGSGILSLASPLFLPIALTFGGLLYFGARLMGAKEE